MALFIRPSNFRCLFNYSFSKQVTGTSIPGFTEFLHTSSRCCAIDKLHLSKLRKKTGFPISHCKKALELHESDLQKAEEWLQKEAQAHGWAKATKLSGRATSQGLIAVHIKGNVGCLVEVNCETDFVAKNADFQALVTKVAEELASSNSTIPENLEHPIKEIIDKDTLSGFTMSDGRKMSDVVALTIGKIGENIQLSRGIKFISPPNLELVGYAHPSRPESVGLLGRYGTVVAFKNTSNAEVIRELCAHIVGMNPDKIGSFDDLEEGKKADKKEKKAADKEEENEDNKEERKPEKEERTLLRQDFLSDPELTVAQVLKENDISVIDFVRLECGGSKKEEVE